MRSFHQLSVNERRRALLAAATVLLLAPTCAPVDPDIALEPFSSCSEMRSSMARMARQEVLYDYRWQGVFGSILLGCSDYGLVGGGKDAGGDTGGASSYSTTNLQEAGVDEADLVKTDGTWLYSLSGQHLVASRAWPVDALDLAATVQVDGNPSGLYLYGDLVIVESSVFGDVSARSGASPNRRAGGELRTLLTFVDVADPTAPQVFRELYVEGVLEESRRVGDRLFLVTYLDLSIEVEADNARQAKRAVNEAQPEVWLPWLFDNRSVDGAWQSDERPTCDCTDVWASEREGGTYLTSVLSLDLSDPDATLSGSAVVGQAETVYATAESLYIAASEYQEGPFPSIDGSLQTIVHKFAIGEDLDRPDYAASAKVQGVLKDRFGLSEYQDILRMATTESDGESSAIISTLQERDGQFSLLDSLGGLGAGETIHATRFVRDIGYVVTYREIDPLFTIDLRDPTDIRLAGSLEMEGWSDYLHPMGDDHLLAVGIGGDWRLQVSLFDVSDLSAPTLVDRVSLDAYGSEAQYDHHAFNYFAEQDALAIPAWSYDDAPGLEILQATTTGLSYTGRLEQTAVIEALPSARQCSPIRRSVIFEDQAYAVSSAGLTVAPLSDPGDVVGALPFVGLDPCWQAHPQGW